DPGRPDVVATSISSFVLGPRGHRLSRYLLTSSSNAAFTFETCRNDSQVRAAATNSVCGSGGGGGGGGEATGANTVPSPAACRSVLMSSHVKEARPWTPHESPQEFCIQIRSLSTSSSSRQYSCPPATEPVIRCCPSAAGWNMSWRHSVPTMTGCWASAVSSASGENACWEALSRPRGPQTRPAE